MIKIQNSCQFAAGERGVAVERGHMAIEKASSKLWKITRDENGRLVMMCISPELERELDNKRREERKKAKEERHLKAERHLEEERRRKEAKEKRRLEHQRCLERQRRRKKKGKPSNREKFKSFHPKSDPKCVRVTPFNPNHSLWGAQGGLCDGNGRDQT